MKITYVLKVGSEGAPGFSHYHLCMQVFAELSTENHQLLVPTDALIFSNHKTAQGSPSFNYFDDLLEWQGT